MRPVSHLIPSMDAVAVRAQQAQVACIGGPVLESVAPCRWASDLSRSVDVVNVENAEIGLATLNTSPAKTLDERDLALPVAWVLVRFETVGIPVSAAAIFRTKSVLAFLSASLAGSAPLPSCGEVAGPTAVLPGAIFQAVGVRLEGLGASSASDFNAALFHGGSISLQREPKYFDIACRRIEDAQRQGRLIA